MENNNPNAISCKVVLIGEAGVGKTSIINRYISNSFSTNSMSTTGASFAAKTMHFDEYDKYVKFEVWDTAGQEKYRSLIKIFYKDASVAVLVYDITRKQSFEEIKNYWVNQIKENASKNLIIVIAANKCDKYELEEVEETKVRAFAKEIGAIFKYTSAKNATGIDELFKAIGYNFLDPNYEEGVGINRVSGVYAFIPPNLEENPELRKTTRLTKENTKGEKKKGCC